MVYSGSTGHCYCAACVSKRQQEIFAHDKAIKELEGMIERGELDHLVKKPTTEIEGEKP